MPYEVRVQNVEPRPIAAVRRRTSPRHLAEVVPQACGEVWQFIGTSGIPHSGLNLALYLDLEMNLECGVIVSRPFDASGSVICSATPGGTVATTAHFGPYNRLGDAHDAIRDWCASRRHRLAGPFWEIYDHWNDDPSQLRTDVFYFLDMADQSTDAGR